MHFNFLNIFVNRNQYPLIFTYLFRVLGVRCTQIPYVVKYINVKIQNTWENIFAKIKVQLYTKKLYQNIQESYIHSKI